MEKFLNFKLIENIFNELYEILPNIIGAILFILIGWLIVKLILFIIKKSLKLTKIDTLVSKISDNGALFNSTTKIEPTKIILAFVKWFLILVLVIVGADMFGLNMVSNGAGRLIDYLPKIFSSIVILGLGLYLASLVRKSVYAMLKSLDLNGSKVISSILFFSIIAIVSITALNQAGINTSIITNNLSLILGAFLVTFVLALGLGSRDVVYRLLLGFYSKKIFEVGQKIRIEDDEGVIVSIDNICITVERNDNNKVVYPIKLIANKKVEIIG